MASRKPQDPPADETTAEETSAVTPGGEPNTTESAPEEWVRAKRDLFVGHVRAVSAGDRVHVSTVENNGWEDDVEPFKPEAAEG